MHEMTHHYLICALWASNDESDEQGGDPLDENYAIEDFAPKALEQAEQDCLAFIAENEGLIGDKFDQAGYDFWLTRNHHGAGFRDRPADVWGGKENGEKLTASAHKFREVNAIVGDDGKLYLE